MTYKSIKIFHSFIIRVLSGGSDGAYSVFCACAITRVTVVLSM